MLYLLDANVLIQAHQKYYPIDLVEPFWDWVVEQAANNLVKIPREILQEIEPGNKESDLFQWIKQNRTILRLNEEPDPELVSKVIFEGYGLRTEDLTDDLLHKIDRDAFLISYAVAKPNRCVVTLERPQEEAKPQNRRIPLVCKNLNICCIDTFRLIRELDFRIPKQ